MLLMEDRMPLTGDTAPQDTNLEETNITSAGETVKRSTRSNVYLDRCPFSCHHSCIHSNLTISESVSNEENSDDEKEEYDEEIVNTRRKEKRRKRQKREVLISPDTTPTVSQHIHIHHHYHIHSTSSPSSSSSSTTTTYMVPLTSPTTETATTLISRGVTNQLPQLPATTITKPTTQLQPSLPQSQPQSSQPATKPHTPHYYRTMAKHFFLAQLQVEDLRDASRIKEIKDWVNHLENQVFISVASQKEYQYTLAKRLARIQMQLNAYNSNRSTR